jgi:gliding motility-associated-like protein
MLQTKKIVFLFLVILSLRMNAQLTVNFNYHTACENSPVQLYYIVDLANDSIVAYDWDFNNDLQYNDASGTLSSNVFSGSGNFSVGLRIVSIFSDTAYFRKDIFVNPLPVANFSVQEVCMNQTIQTVDQSVANGANIKYYNWTFDASASVLDSAGYAPKYFFSTEGLHNIRLDLITAAGCVASVHKDVQVNPIPKADFTVNNSCIGDTSFFSSQPSINSGTVSQFLWDFNSDGQFSDASGIDAKYAFFSTGNWPVSLRVISAKGCAHDTLKSIAVYPRPHALFTHLDVCENSSVDINNISFTDFGTLSYSWTFGDGDTSSAFEPTHAYSNAGSYGLKLKVNSVFSCVDSIVKNIVVYPLPSVNFSAVDVCLNKAMNFTDASSSVSAIKQYSWNFGDGVGTISQNPSHVFQAAGSYDVSLEVETTDGCKASAHKTVKVFALPLASIYAGVTNLCEGDSTFLQGINLAGKTYVWSTGSVEQGIYVKQADQYELIVFDNNNCWSKDSVTIVVNEVPHFNYSSDTTLTLGTPLSLYADGYYDFIWKDEQNNIVNQKAEFDLTPFETQKYTVTATNDKDCSTTRYINVNVIKDYNLVANDFITPNGDGKNDVWKINYITVYPDCDVIVFNRWGQEVYRSAGGYQNNWGGVASNGAELPDGAYYYVITCSGMKKDITGPLTILRARE